MQPTLYTIGYEGAEIGAFVAALITTRVSLIIDIRDVAHSRKPGFSKTSLQQHLASVGIDYIHIRELGDPKPGRTAAREGNYDLFRKIYKAHLRTDNAKAALRSTDTLLKANTACLLCFEHDHIVCHRAIVAERLAEAAGAHVRHLRAPRAVKLGRTGTRTNDCGLSHDGSRCSREGAAAHEHTTR